MSRGAGNNVRGPTSALTEFLRESGITPTTIARRAATRAQQQAQGQEQGQEQPVAGSSNQSPQESHSASRDASPRLAGRRGRGRARGRASRLRFSGNVSDDLDEDQLGEAEVPDQELEAQVETNTEAKEEEEVEAEKTTASKKRKLTKTTAAKLKALKANEKKRRGIKDSDDDDYEDGDDDEYTAPSRIMRNTVNAVGKGNNKGPKPAPGSFENCVKCEKRFTVTVYTQAAVSGSGWLCHVCTKATGSDPFKNGRQAAGQRGRKKAPTDKRTVNNFEERRFPTLVSLCVQIITKHIDDVEALGDIGTMNVEAISKALSKNRCLTAENAQLFYSPTNTTLTLYDATNLPSDAFDTLAYLNPNLTTLRLDFCGQITDTAMRIFATSLPNLTSIELLGPFLVKPPAWQQFFSCHPKLEKFLITQSPRFDLDCLESLVDCCGESLVELRLKEVGKLCDEFLLKLATLGNVGAEDVEDAEEENKSKLEYLDLSDPSESCSEDAVIALLSAIGENLTYLDLSKHLLLLDEFLEQGLGPNMKSLRTLVLNNIPGLTDKGVQKLFSSWSSDPSSTSTPMSTSKQTTLIKLDLSRNHLLGDKALKAILKHSGKDLEELNINGWKNVSEEALMEIGKVCTSLKKLDVGWVRDVTDFVVSSWVDGVSEVEGQGQGRGKQRQVRQVEDEDEDENENQDEDEDEDEDGDVRMKTVTTRVNAAAGGAGGAGGRKIGGCKNLEEVKVWGCNRITPACPRRKGMSIYGAEANSVIRSLV